MRFGGCRVDMPKAGWTTRARSSPISRSSWMSSRITTHGNEILMARNQGIGKLSRALAINTGITGPMLRADGCGLRHRKVDHYGLYDRFQFRVPPWAIPTAICYDRYMIPRARDARSLKILEQALASVPEGPIIDPKAKCAAFDPRAARPTAASKRPRVNRILPHQRWNAPSPPLPRPSAQPHQPDHLEDMCLGQNHRRCLVILGSVDIVLGEVDR